MDSAPTRTWPCFGAIEQTPCFINVTILIVFEQILEARMNIDRRP